MVELDKIYCEDCLETLSKMEDNSVDLIITSPPYNKGYWATNRCMSPNENTFHTKSRRIDYGVFDDTMQPEDYEKWQRSIIEECLRVLKPEGSLWYNHMDILSRNRCIHPTYVWDYPVKQMIVWERKTTPKIAHYFFFPTTEYLFWIGKNPDTRPYFNKKDADYKKVVWEIEPDRHSDHPAPFPIELPINIIKCCSKEGDIVYDPFMGSGTVAKAARDLNRHYIGSELNPDYIIMANERLGIL